MTKYTLYMGLNDKDTKVQKIDTLEAYKIVENYLLSCTDGATIFHAKGIYKHEDGTFVTEETLRIELLFVELESVRQIVNTLKVLFNQETIAVQMQEITSDLW